jgi:adenylyltransferase/sulfurtransferase
MRDFARKNGFLPIFCSSQFALIIIAMEFTKDQLLRYSRHFILPEAGVEGQEKLFGAKVFVVGAGGLGSPVGYYLAAAGVGSLAIIDNDAVDLTNLQRQIAHSTKSLGVPKAASAKATFEALNPDVTVTAIQDRLTATNIERLIDDQDIVVDCSDNFVTRFLVNDACVLMNKPLVTGAILRFEGQVTTILPHRGHCYRCLFEDMPPPELRIQLQTSGLLGAVPGIIGGLQALEVLKLILGAGEPLSGRLLIFNGLKSSFREIEVRRNPDCPVCGKEPSITSLSHHMPDTPESSNPAL